MAVDEHSRHQLYQKLQEVLGVEDATTLMAHLPAGGVGQLATKDDVGALKADLEHKVDSVRNELLIEIHEVRTEIHRTARHLTLSLTMIMAVLNGIVFTALKLS